MFLRIRKLSPIYFFATGVALKPEEKNDKTSNKTKLTYDELTPWERVKQIFSPIFNPQEGGIQNEDFAFIATNTSLSALLGGSYGAAKRGQLAFQNFVDNNDATKFANPHDAKVQLSRIMTLEMMKGALVMGAKFATLVGIYTVTTTCVSVYRGKNGILEHMTAGFVMGSLYRINYGLRGMIVGGTAGCILATVYGIGQLLILKMAGIDSEEIRREQYALYTWSARMDRKVEDKANLKDMNPIEKGKLLSTQHLPIGLDHLPDESEETKVKS